MFWLPHCCSSLLSVQTRRRFEFLSFLFLFFFSFFIFKIIQVEEEAEVDAEINEEAPKKVPHFKPTTLLFFIMSFSFLFFFFKFFRSLLLIIHHCLLSLFSSFPQEPLRVFPHLLIKKQLLSGSLVEGRNASVSYFLFNAGSGYCSFYYLSFSLFRTCLRYDWIVFLSFNIHLLPLELLSLSPSTTTFSEMTSRKLLKTFLRMFLLDSFLLFSI